MKRILGGALTALLAIIVASSAPWGCVNPNTRAQRAQRDRNSEVPDGGWQNYKPPGREWQPDPARSTRDSALATPNVVPVTPASPSISPNH